MSRGIFESLKGRAWAVLWTAVAGIWLLSGSESALAGESKRVYFDIPAQSLSTALLRFSEQAQVQITAPSQLVNDRQFAGIRGEYGPAQALRQMLQGSGLSFEFINEGAVTIRAARSAGDAQNTESSTGVRLAQVDSSGVQTESTRNTGNSNDTSEATKETADSKLEEIIVTATKREERISDVPISISAYGQAEMDTRGIRDISDIAAITPGLDFQSNGVIQSIAIRGIEPSAANDVGAQTTAVYINDAPVQVRYGGGTLNGPRPQVFDLERVEVLRGPQGTLFGGSAMGGAVRFITPEPSLTDYSGYARAEMADTRGGELSQEAGAAFGGPIVEGKLGFRVSVWQRREGGYVDYESRIPGGVREKNADRADTYVARLALAFAPTDNLRITPSLYAQDFKQGGLSAFLPSLSDPSDNRFVVNDLLREPIRDKFQMPGLKVEWGVANLNFTSISSYMHRRYEDHLDYTDLIPDIFGTPRPTSADFYEDTGVFSSQNSFTQELRLANADPAARLQWTVGAFYSRMKVNGTQNLEAPGFPQYILDNFGVPIETLFGAGLVDDRFALEINSRYADVEQAGFVNAEYELFGGISAIAGVRVSRLKNDNYRRTAGALFGGATEFTAVHKETAVTPKFGVNYKLNEDNLFYVSVGKGFRPGGSYPIVSFVGAPGCDAALDELGGIPGFYDSDSVWSYELGSKNTVLDGRLSVNASVYHIDWNDIQQSIFVPACASGFLSNFGQATSEGFDLALATKLTTNLTADVSVGYTSVEFAQDARLLDNIYARKGEHITTGLSSSGLAPWNITAALRYDFDISSTVAGYVRVENRYRSKNHGPFAADNPDNVGYNPNFALNNALNDARNELNVRTGVAWDNFEVSAFATNVLNAHPFHNVTLEPFTYSGAYTLRPFTFGLSGHYRW